MCLCNETCAKVSQKFELMLKDNKHVLLITDFFLKYNLNTKNIIRPTAPKGTKGKEAGFPSLRPPLSPTRSTHLSAPLFSTQQSNLSPVVACGLKRASAVRQMALAPKPCRCVFALRRPFRRPPEKLLSLLCQPSGPLGADVACANAYHKRRHLKRHCRLPS